METVKRRRDESLNMKKVLSALVDRSNYRDEGIKGSKSGELGGAGMRYQPIKGILGKKLILCKEIFIVLGILNER